MEHLRGFVEEAGCPAYRRLGQGAGYYDLTIAALRASGKPVAAGVGFSAQAIEAAPREAHDQRLDWIVTEAEAIEIRAHDDATPERGDVRDEARDET